MKTVELATTNMDPIIDSRALTYRLPEDVFMIVNESLRLYKNANDTSISKNVKGIRQIVPLNHLEYARVMSRPFKEPLKYKAWRLISESSPDTTQNPVTGSTDIEIITTTVDRNTYDKIDYLCRYVRRPNPIILEDLSTYGSDITIEGQQAITPCELDPSIHEIVLQRAVELAKIAWNADANQTQLEVTAGQRSE